MLTVLVGASGTGKSTIARLMQDAGVDRIVSMTTRQRRPYEKNGWDYFFMTQKQFTDRLHLNEFAEYDEYGQGRMYGTLKSQYDPEKNQVVILTPHGVRMLRKTMPSLPMRVVYLESSLRDRVIRCVERCGAQFSMEDMVEIGARVQRDFGMFSGFHDEADCVFINATGETNLYDLADELVEETAK